MAPDLNSLPHSPPPSVPIVPAMNSSSVPVPIPTEPANINTPPSPHSPSLSSLQAAASINAGIRNSPDRNSPRFERRRSSLMMNIHLNDPSVPGPGEMVHSHIQGMSPSGAYGQGPQLPENPQHHRAPSLGEIHQQLENEQEAQVNRLLQMIRSQQAQINSLQTANPSSPSDGTSQALLLAQSSSAIDSGSALRTPSIGTGLNTRTQSASTNSSRQRPMSLSRQSSSRLSATGVGGPQSDSQSPMLRPLSMTYDPQREDWLLGGVRDESAFYQAETQMLTRENQMLKQRIRDLERQLGDTAASPSSHSAVTSHLTNAVSPLASPPIIPESQPQP
ncbi:hypothetical protein AAFC00_002345 [Neodothiora populina]|uniref:Uncharacterized protein n=1 Tax=Neodothiora populina TaxID=2781224 RepID=A0ABR3PHE1_9PEZI